MLTHEDQLRKAIKSGGRRASDDGFFATGAGGLIVAQSRQFLSVLFSAFSVFPVFAATDGRPIASFSAPSKGSW